MSHRKRILIVGRVAAGSSCAARARRLDEDAEIVVFEKGPYVSFANCGLPYHVGDVIEDESSLLLVSPEQFQDRHAITVHVNHEVTGIDTATRSVAVRDLAAGSTRTETYDALVLATGSKSFRPPVEGLDLPGVFTLRTVPDTRRVKEWLAETKAWRAAVIGAGFVGLEVAENLAELGLQVTVVDLAEQVMPPLDPEMAAAVATRLEQNGVTLHLGDGLARIERDEHLRVATSSGAVIDADIVVLGLGVRPRTELARDAGIAIGKTGGIAVDDQMRTSAPHVWAVGDVTEDRCSVTGLPRLLPLAGPANREGRLAADVICGRTETFRGVQGTAVCRLFGLTAAITGRAAKELRALDIAYETAWLHPKDHVGYYPGAKTMNLKVLYDPETGRVLGAQGVGEAGVEKRIDVVAMCLQLGGSVFDLEQAELCYAPQIGAAKDPVNLAGMIAANRMRGDLRVARWDELGGDELLVDVREVHEFDREHIPGALNLPLSVLRDRFDELPTDRPIWLYCLSGKRSYDAARALMGRGFDAWSLPGGIKSWKALRSTQETATR